MSYKKTLIAYYSHSGNTKRVAEIIQRVTNGDLFEIKPIKEYPKNYNEVVAQAQIEKKENTKPDLYDNGNVVDYDVIYIGTPVWWYTFAPPVRTFLSKNDFKGKTIVPFCTHGGGREATTYTDIKKLAPYAEMKDGFTSYGNTATVSEVQNWIEMQNL